MPTAPPSRRHNEQLSESERRRIIGMMENVLSARRVTHHLGIYDFIVGRFWDLYTRERSVTRRPGLGRTRQTNSREDRHIIRHALIAPTVSMSAIHTQTKLLLRFSASVRTNERYLAEGLSLSRCPLRVLPLISICRHLRSEWCRI
ncbi:transposable element Tcb2 transposase [Trichonephila clavipes]|nr:transposable element Tcb2 transposase [Trichonephila clavipes]